MKDDQTLDIPIEGFLGILAAGMKGRIAPRWLCMSESAKLEYIAEGKELFAEFLRQEAEAKRRRDEGNPRAFFTG